MRTLATRFENRGAIHTTRYYYDYCARGRESRDLMGTPNNDVSKMDIVTRQLAVSILIVCSEKQQKQKVKRALMRKCLRTWSQHGLSVLQLELEVRI